MLFKIKSFFLELKRRSTPLYYLGVVFSILFFIFALSIAFCEGSVNDLCHLLKPGKFAGSFALYAFTLGWFLEYLKEALGKKNIERIAWLTVFLSGAEMFLIFIESAISTEYIQNLSFSEKTGDFINKSLYFTFNSLIILSSLLTLYVALLFFKPISLKPAVYLFAIRASFLIFIISCFLGVFMLHTYGQEPSSPGQWGLPFTHFFNYRNNLLTLHFAGIHSVQILPFCTYYFDRYIGKRTLLTVLGIYLTLCFAIVL